jgi:hypothetical protein
MFSWETTLPHNTLSVHFISRGVILQYTVGQRGRQLRTTLVPQRRSVGKNRPEGIVG